ncbi:uncharacterized protein BXIN_1515 [Babesia sp. Xinjiang]|uniref:uncharacterized protein n=1 Tax=Babesia sp. Xinjiang TaxID=462227 RepID=UPI000A22EB8C|nr:uncharacterized protein BXIN_1515 [Babesia sp. Xinjiang]ORM42249.1 hypothetical protein BXIN_1515 [Babesia sp. Xinjiang]
MESVEIDDGMTMDKLLTVLRETKWFEKLNSQKKIYSLLGLILVASVLIATAVGVSAGEKYVVAILGPVLAFLLVSWLCSLQHLGPSDMKLTKYQILAAVTVVLVVIGLVALVSICGLTISAVTSKTDDKLSPYAVGTVAFVVYSWYAAQTHPCTMLFEYIFGVAAVLLLSGCVGLSVLHFTYENHVQKSSAIVAPGTLAAINVILLVAVLYFAHCIGLLDITFFKKYRGLTLGSCTAAFALIGVVVVVKNVYKCDDEGFETYFFTILIGMAVFVAAAY